MIAGSYGLFIEGTHLAVEQRDDVVTLRLWFDPDVRLLPAAVEFALLSMLHMAAQYHPDGVPPGGVRFAHPRVSYADAVEAFFGCPAVFDARENAVDLDRESLESPLRTSNALSAAVLQARVRELGETTGRAAWWSASGRSSPGSCPMVYRRPRRSRVS